MGKKKATEAVPRGRTDNLLSQKIDCLAGMGFPRDLIVESLTRPGTDGTVTGAIAWIVEELEEEERRRRMRSEREAEVEVERESEDRWRPPPLPGRTGSGQWDEGAASSDSALGLVGDRDGGVGADAADADSYPSLSDVPAMGLICADEEEAGRRAAGAGAGPGVDDGDTMGKKKASATSIPACPLRPSASTHPSENSAVCGTAAAAGAAAADDPKDNVRSDKKKGTPREAGESASSTAAAAHGKKGRAVKKENDDCGPSAAAASSGRPEVAPPSEPPMTAHNAGSVFDQNRALQPPLPSGDGGAGSGPETVPTAGPRAPPLTFYAAAAASSSLDRVPPRASGGGAGRTALLTRGGGAAARPHEREQEELDEGEGENENGDGDGDGDGEAFSAYVVPEGGGGTSSDRPGGRTRRRADAIPHMDPREPAYEGIALSGAGGADGRHGEADGGEEEERRRKLRRRRVLLSAGAVFAVIVAAAVIAAVVVATTTSSRSSSSSPPSSENVLPDMPAFVRTTARYDDIKTFLLSHKEGSDLFLSPSSREALNDPVSPQGKALEWLANEDGRRIDLTSDPLSLVQRFALAVLYYSTGGPESWEERCNFLSVGHECLWKVPGVEGVHEMNGVLYPQIGTLCGDGRVGGLVIVNNNMTGALPTELSLLRGLRLLVFSKNNLTGPIPTTLLTMPYLENIFISNNHLSGSIPEISLNEVNGTATTHLRAILLHINNLNSTVPPSLGKLSNLTHLHLAHNQLTGSVPSDLGLLSNLVELNLDSNFLNGTLHFPTSAFPKLKHFWVFRNLLTGPFPRSVLGLNDPTLTMLDLSENLFTGTLPSEIGNVSSMVNFDIHENALTGTIPEEIWDLSHLLRLGLYTNKLKGTLSGLVGKLTILERLFINENELHGTLPDELGDMTNLEALGLAGNNFSGHVPESLVNLQFLNTLTLYNNSFTGDLAFLCNMMSEDLFSRADCLGGESRPGGRVLTCTCCTECCGIEDDVGVFGCFPNV